MNIWSNTITPALYVSIKAQVGEARETDELGRSCVRKAAVRRYRGTLHRETRELCLKLSDAREPQNEGGRRTEGLEYYRMGVMGE